jgi:hypothetical protein
VIEQLLWTKNLLKDYSFHFSNNFKNNASGLDFESTHVDGRMLLPTSKIYVIHVCG